MTPVVRLHDVENVEAFCSRILSAQVKRNGGYLRPDAREEALGHLLVTAFELGDRFELKTITFKQYASQILGWRVNDWYRKTLGDNRARRTRPREFSLELVNHDEQVPSALTVGSHEDEVLTRVALCG